MRCVVLLAGILGIASCGPPEARTASAVAGLKEYTPEEASMFGDTLAPALFGHPEHSTDANDEKLSTRTRDAGTVIPVRVSTVTRETLAGAHGYLLVLTPTEPPLRGEAPPSPLELRIRPGGPALTRIATADTKFVGTRFIIFLREYSEAGERALHFHGEADTPAVRARILSAKMLDGPPSGVQTPP